MTPEELAQAIKRLIDKEQIPMSDFLEIISRNGHFKDEKAPNNRKAQCRAATALMQVILRDDEIKELVQRVFEVHALRTILEDLLPYYTGHDSLLPSAFRTEAAQRLEAAQRKVAELRHSASRKVALLQALRQQLDSLGCEEQQVDLPPLTEAFPPLSPAA